MQFFQWIATNWQAICAWAGGLYLAYHIGRLFASLVLVINALVKRFQMAEGTLVAMATNHLPHLQVELEKTNLSMLQSNALLLDIRKDLRAVLKIEEADE